MSAISNDKELREALDAMDVQGQRTVGALFVENVIELSDDKRVPKALAAARDSAISNEDLGLARRAIKSASLDAHARCGADGEWNDQAGYFVARAAEACIEPQVLTQAKGPAWKAAMMARMARTCLAADSDEDTHDSERLAQYDILNKYLDA